ncbi:MAG TPA: Na+/H+ antiporter subunit E [Syntrophales bacterium]|nr:Na+/H+ antiporter subunit E [Syntrophales bacterium]
MTGIRRLLPQPWLSILLFLVWLLVQNDLSALVLISGLALAVAIPMATRVFWPNPPRLHRPATMVRLVLRVLGDIIRANIEVAALILGPTRRLQPAFVEFSLELRDEFAIGILAGIISLTPGTVTADISADHRKLLIHALNVVDEAALVAAIRERYEKPLQEVFICSTR